MLLSPAPSGPPKCVHTQEAPIYSSSSIVVTWSPPVGRADGYVILYSTDGTSNMTQLVEGGNQTSALLTAGSPLHLQSVCIQGSTIITF